MLILEIQLILYYSSAFWLYLPVCTQRCTIRHADRFSPQPTNVNVFARRWGIAVFIRLREAVALTEPLTKVDQAATLVAEGSPLRFRNPGDRFTAIGTGNRLGRCVHVRRGGKVCG